MSDDEYPLEWYLEAPAPQDLTPVPVARFNARVRAAVLGWCSDDATAMLHLGRDTLDNRDLPEILMAVGRVYQADMFASAGRDLTIARLRADLEIDRATAAEEAQ